MGRMAGKRFFRKNQSVPELFHGRLFETGGGLELFRCKYHDKLGNLSEGAVLFIFLGGDKADTDTGTAEAGKGLSGSVVYRESGKQLYAEISL